MSTTKVTFEIGKILSRSGEVFKNNLGPLLGATLVMWVILGVSGVIYIGPLVLAGPLTLGLYKMVQAALRGQPVEFGDLFSGFQKFLPAFLANLIITVFSAIGMIFCIIPGLLIGILYIPTYLFILDDNLEFWNAMEASRKMVMNNFGQWIILALVLFVLNLAGALVCCIGMAVTMPISMIAIAIAYTLEREAASGTTPGSSPPPVSPGA